MLVHSQQLGRAGYNPSQVEKAIFESRPEGRKEVGCAGTSVKSISGRCKVLGWAYAWNTRKPGVGVGWEDVAEKGQEGLARAEPHRPM